MNVQRIYFANDETEFSKIHIIDDDPEQRVQLARSLYRLGYHAELYESVEEYRCQVRSNGIVFAKSIDVIREILSLEYKPFLFTPIVGYSCNPDTETVVSALREGALDYISWPMSEIDLQKRLIDVQKQIDYCEAEERQRSSARELVKNLSRREHDVLECIIAGYSNKDTARVLDISPRTVEIHRANMMTKLRVSSGALAVRIGIYAGLDESQKRAVHKVNLAELNKEIFLVGKERFSR